MENIKKKLASKLQCLSSPNYAAFCTHNCQTNSDIYREYKNIPEIHDIIKFSQCQYNFRKHAEQQLQLKIETFLSENVALRPCRDQVKLLLRIVIETERSHFHYYGGFTSDLMNEKAAQEAIPTKPRKPIKKPILRTVENRSFSTLWCFANIKLSWPQSYE